ncbi:MAG TPA: hypothetical protein DCQ58_06915, partial [Saprospirales bacterium]|nr:hypothetical protein [Saprospirales bacterium]
RRWKALHYYVRKAYNEVLVSPIIEGKNVEIHVVSDRLAPIEAKMDIKLLDFKGNVLRDISKTISIPANSSANYFTADKTEFLKGHPSYEVFLHIQVLEGNALLSENNLFFEAPKDLKLPKPTVQREIRTTVAGMLITLKTDVFAKNILLSTEGEAFFADNYFDLLPGQTLT